MSDDNVVYGGWGDRPGRGDHNDGNTPQGPTDMEARVAKLEAHVDHMRQDTADIKTDLRGLRSETGEGFGGIRKDMREDFRLLFSALVVAALGLAGIMAKGFGWLP